SARPQESRHLQDTTGYHTTPRPTMRHTETETETDSDAANPNPNPNATLNGPGEGVGGGGAGGKTLRHRLSRALSRVRKDHHKFFGVAVLGRGYPGRVACACGSLPGAAGAGELLSFFWSYYSELFAWLFSVFRPSLVGGVTAAAAASS
ncbi:hypothetical protein FB451DRAFT_1184004, partial [Mycena latifolia]